MTEADGVVLTANLAQLGRDLGQQITFLGQLEETSVDAEGDFKVAYSKVFRNATGSVEDRKQAAICETDPLWRIWGKAAAAVRMQRESLKALHARIEIGRTMVSREKALVSLAGRDGTP